MKLIFIHQPNVKVTFFRNVHATVLVGLLCFFLPGIVTAQVLFEETAPHRYFIEFTDKNNNPFSLADPGAFLSERAIARRNSQDIPLLGNDLPVTPAYIDSIRFTGARILNVSKWFNAVTVEVPSDTVLNRIAGYSFVKKNISLKSRYVPSLTHSGGIQSAYAPVEYDYGVSGWQTAIHNGNVLHNLEYTGKGIVIAQLDAGFYHVDRLSAFSSLWPHQILGWRDFVKPGSNVFEGNSHGMVVLSIMAGSLPGQLAGTAPDASFLLLRTEDTGSEYPIEEDNWTSAAEFADSAGADVINSSLGYSRFDDENMDLTYSDMNGNSARITRAADIASSKGIVVVTSAGNLGTSGWHYISAPADADSVLSVGAIDANGYVAGFSSRGPTSDHRVKPDVVGIGKGTWMADYTLDSVRQGNGTSLSAPIIAGLVACLWQANRGATSQQIVKAVKESSDRYAQPDDDYGYGIPDFALANVLLKHEEQGSELQGKIVVYPNPFRSELYMVFPEPLEDEVDVSLYDLTGKEVFHSVFPPFPGGNYINIDLSGTGISTGVYILKTTTGARSEISKIVRF